MSWFWAWFFLAGAAWVVVEQEPVELPWWLYALLCICFSASEFSKALKKRRG